MKCLFIRKKTLQTFICIALLIIIFCSITLLFLEDVFLFASDEMDLSKVSFDPSVGEDTFASLRHLYQNPEKVAYLTFDDGPTKKATAKILAILEEEEIKANFFVVGKHVQEYPELVKREYESGHYIANHGFSHNNRKLYQSKNSFLFEILQTDAAISQAIGVTNYHSYLFRFPNGSIGKAYHSQKAKSIDYLQEIHYTYLDWNALNHDSVKKYSQQDLLTNLKKSCQNKGTLIILMHDTGDVNNTYDVLADSIRYLKQEGYVFRTFYDFFPKQSQEAS